MVAATTELNVNGDGPILLCVPPAGMGAEIFRAWVPHLGRTVQLLGIGPGRLGGESRSGRGRAAAIACDAARYGHRRVAVFGHSAGCCTALEIAAALAAVVDPLDVFLAAPPPSPAALASWSRRSDGELFADLVRLGQVRATGAANRRLVSRVAASVRDDVAAAHRSALALAAGPSLAPTTVEVWRGADDPASASTDRRRRVLGVPVTRTVTFAGGHFFPFDPRSGALRHLERRLLVHDHAPRFSAVSS